MQEVKHVKQAPTPARGFADLLQAMLGGGDCFSAPGTEHGTANPVLDRQPVNTASRPKALGDVTNTQGHVGGSASDSLAGKARTAVAAAASTLGKTAAATCCVSKPENKGASRRSARVQAKNQQSKSDKKQPSDASPAVQLTLGACQVKQHTVA